MAAIDVEGARRRVRDALDVRRRRAVNAVELVGWRRSDGPKRRTVVFGDPLPTTGGRETVPVVLCVWRRLDRLQRTLDLLERQEGAAVSLHIWNNDRRSSTQVENVTSSTRIETHVTHSSHNIGGFGRFYLARELAADHGYAIFIDDDLTFGSDMAIGLISERRPRSIVSQWSFRLCSPSDYHLREELSPGEQADYCGTGGMIVDTQVFRDDLLFRCPRRYWFMEDLWLSFYAAHVLGWELRKSGVRFEEDHDGLDQFAHLSEGKSRFLRHLTQRGWEIPRRPDRAAAVPVSAEAPPVL